MDIHEIKIFIKDYSAFIILIIFALPVLVGDDEKRKKYIKGVKIIVKFSLGVLIKILSPLSIIGKPIKFLIKKSYQKEQQKLNENIEILTKIKNDPLVMQKYIFDITHEMLVQIYYMCIFLFVLIIAKNGIFKILNYIFLGLSIGNPIDHEAFIIATLFFILSGLFYQMKDKLFSLQRLSKQAYDIDNSILIQAEEIKKLDDKIKNLTSN